MNPNATLEYITQNYERLIEEHNVYTVEDLCMVMRISKQTFYTLMRQEDGTWHDEFDPIRRKLSDVRYRLKERTLNKIHESNDKTLILASMRLLGTNEDRKKLSTQYLEVAGDNGGPIGLEINTRQPIEHQIRFIDMTKDEEKED